MGINWDRAIIAVLTATLFGLAYAAIVHWACQRDPEHPYTAVLVVFGVTLTLGAAAIVVPIQWVVAIAIAFAITGTPQIVGSMIREAARRRGVVETARQQIQETLPR